MNESIPPPLPELARDVHKGSAGRVLALCGSPTMPGAAILVARAAQRAGAGLVTVGALDLDLIRSIAPASPETIYLDLSDQRELVAGLLPRAIRKHPHEVIVAGPGLGQSGRVRQLILRVVDDSSEAVPLVLDADALNVMASELSHVASRSAPVMLTPHPGEAARLLGSPVGASESERRAACEEIARRSRAICVLKGAGTVVSDGTETWVNPSGNPGMATAGSGDVLSGILGAYLAQWARGLEGPGVEGRSTLLDVVRRAVYDHGCAGDRAAQVLGARAVIASDLISHLGGAGG